MKWLTAVAIIVVVVFAAGSSGFCAEHTSHDEGHNAHHCIASCHAGCCGAVLQDHQFRIALSLLFSVTAAQAAPFQTAFDDGIKHPPKVSA